MSVLKRVVTFLNVGASLSIIIACATLTYVLTTARSNPQPSPRASPVSAIPKETIDPGPDLSKTPSTAEAVIVEFADFSCRYCAAFAAETLPTLVTDYVRPGKVRFYSLSYPLNQHDELSRLAASAAECSRDGHNPLDSRQSLYNLQGAMSRNAIIAAGAALGYDTDALSRCMDAETTARTLSQHKLIAERLQVQSTPTFFFGRVENGRLTLTHRLNGNGGLAVFREHLTSPAAD